jgi:hypothetical protein
MMKLAVVFFLVSLFLAPLPTLAIEFHLPQLIGDYEAPFESRLVAIDLGGSVEGLSVVSIELTGTIFPSWASAVGDTSEWGGSFNAELGETGLGYWFAFTDFELTGEFNATIVFINYSGLTWDFLNDGIGDLTFGFFPHGLVGIVDGTGPPPTGTISSATLVLDGTVAIESLPWSHIKALYR